MELNSDYWESRYQKNEIGWDAGEITTPLKEYINQLVNKDIKILIPGAGNGHEFDYLIHKGFKNVFVVDLAPTPLQNIAKRNPDFKSNLIQDNFFNLNEKFDLIIEQTFFCALDPNLRPNYSVKVNELLNSNGKIAGLLFDFPLTESGPPFGGSIDEYINLFSEKFKLKTLEKEARPLIANFNDEQLTDFINKHLFDRNYYYFQSKHTIDCALKNKEEIILDIKALLA